MWVNRSSMARLPHYAHPHCNLTPGCNSRAQTARYSLRQAHLMISIFMECYMTDQYLTDAEVAKRLGLSKATIWRHAKAGLLPKPVKLGHASRWPESDIQAVMDRLKAERDGAATEEAA